MPCWSFRITDPETSICDVLLFIFFNLFRGRIISNLTSVPIDSGFSVLKKAPPEQILLVISSRDSCLLPVSFQINLAGISRENLSIFLFSNRVKVRPLEPIINPNSWAKKYPEYLWLEPVIKALCNVNQHLIFTSKHKRSLSPCPVVDELTSFICEPLIYI